jgi:hypothetical protein
MRCSAADIKKVGWFPAFELDDVHGSHGKTSSICKDTDVSFSVNVLQLIALCNSFLIVDLSAVLLTFELSLSEQGIVVNNDLSTGSYNLLVFCVDQGVDFYDLSISLDEAIVQVLQEENHFRFLVRDSQIVGNLLKLDHAQALLNIDKDLPKIFVVCLHSLQAVERIWMGPVPAAIYYHWHPSTAIMLHAYVEFLSYLQFFNNVYASAEESLLSGLRGHQYFPAHILSYFLHFFWGLANVDTSAEPCFFEISLLTASCLDLYIKQLFCLPRP